MTTLTARALAALPRRPGPPHRARRRRPPLAPATRRWRQGVRALLTAGVLGSAVAMFSLLGLGGEDPALRPLAASPAGTPLPGLVGPSAVPAPPMPASPPPGGQAAAGGPTLLPPPGAAPAPPTVVMAAAPPPAASPAANAHLPFMPGARVVADDTQAPGGADGQWSATLQTSAPMAEVTAYYRSQLQQRAQPGDPPLEDVNAGPGQQLLSQVNMTTNERHAVWIGPGADGALTVRLVHLKTAP